MGYTNESIDQTTNTKIGHDSESNHLMKMSSTAKFDQGRTRDLRHPNEGQFSTINVLSSTKPPMDKAMRRRNIPMGDKSYILKSSTSLNKNSSDLH